MGKVCLGFGLAIAAVLLWMWVTGMATMSIIECGGAARCELATDSESMLVLTAYTTADREIRDSTAGWELRRQYPNLVLAERILRIDRGTRVHEVDRTPPTVERSPRYARVLVMDGKYSGRELLAFAEHIVQPGQGGNQ